MEKSHSSNHSSNKPYLVVIILLLAVIIGIVVYFLFFHTRANSAESQQPENTITPPETANITDDPNAETYTKSTPLGSLECIKDQIPNADYCIIDSSQIKNARKGITYTLTSDTSEFDKLAKVEIDKSDAKKATVKFNAKIVEEFYDVKNLSYPIYLTFSREIASYHITGFGQGVGDEYILFVMKDGTLGMLSVHAVVKEKKYDPYYVKNVKDVTSIVDGATYSDYGGGRTSYAVTKDKTAYDLQTLLPSWGEN